MRYRLQRHDGTDCSATMVPITVLRMVPIQRYRHIKIINYEIKLNENGSDDYNFQFKITAVTGIRK